MQKTKPPTPKPPFSHQPSAQGVGRFWAGHRPCLVRVGAALAASAFAAGCVQQQNFSVPSTQDKVVLVSGQGELRETEREPSYSIIEVPVVPPGGAESSLFILRGACAVLRARGFKYFASEKMPGARTAFRLTFPETATQEQLQGPSKSVFSLAECSSLRF